MLRSIPPLCSPSSSEEFQDNDRPTVFKIGSGTFGTVYMHTGTPYVYKKCRSVDGCAEMAEEYRHMKLISEALLASGNTILAPTPLDFHDHDDVAFWEDTAICFPECDNTTTCLYSMTRVYPLPTRIKKRLVDLFCPPALNKKAQRRGDYLARLLLGRPEPNPNRSAPQRFFSTYNFPLTRGRAEQLGIDTTLLSGEMGRMLAQFHMTARNDARDIEVVLGANIANTFNHETRSEHRVWVVDFNQVKYFDFTEAQIPLLVAGFFGNEAYFPRARPADPLYIVFSQAYIDECNKIGEIAGKLGHKFIVALEAEQARQDTKFQ